MAKKTTKQGRYFTPFASANTSLNELKYVFTSFPTVLNFFVFFLGFPPAMLHIRFTRLLKYLTLLIVTVWQILVIYIINICLTPVDSWANYSQTFIFDRIEYLYKYILQIFFFIIHIVLSLNFFLHFYLAPAQKPTINQLFVRFLKCQIYYSVQLKRLSSIVRWFPKGSRRQGFTNTYIFKRLRFSTTKFWI